MKNKSKFILLVTSSALLLAGCGGGNSNDNSKAASSNDKVASSPSSSSVDSPIGTSSSSKSTETSSSPSSESSISSTSSESAKTYYTVSFDSMGGSEVPSQSIEEGYKATKPYDPTKTDYRFDGWFLSNKYTKEFDFNTAITTDYTLFAKWVSSPSSSSLSSSSSDSSSSDSISSSSSENSSSESSSSSDPDPISSSSSSSDSSTSSSSDSSSGQSSSSSAEQSSSSSAAEPGSSSSSDSGSSGFSSSDGSSSSTSSSSNPDSSSSSVSSSSSSTPEVTYVDYWIAGDFDGTSWEKDSAIQMEANKNGEDLGAKFNVSIEAGESFKVTNFTAWYGYNDSLSSVASCGTNGNIVIKETGIYNIYLNQYSSVWVEKASSSGQSSSSSSSSSEPTSSPVSSQSSSSSSSEGSSTVKHAPDNAGNSSWYIIGEGSLWADSSWEIESGIGMFTNPGTTDLACYLNINFTKGDYFKFFDGNSYAGYSNVNTWDDPSNLGKSNFVADDMDNFKCNVSGTYSIYLNNYQQVWICA